MLSYEDIFMRHNSYRPLSYLTKGFDSPVPSRRADVVLRAFTLPKDRRPRPASTTCLDSIPRYYSGSFKTDLESIPTFYSNNSKNSSNRTPRHYSNSFKTSLESIPLSCSDNYSNSLNRSPRHCGNSFKTSLENIPRSCSDNIKTSVDSSPRHYRNGFKTSLESIPRYCSDHHKTPADSSPKHFRDNYRLTSTLPSQHLSRREIPLCTPDDLLDIIREPSGYYALPTDPWNEVYPDIYLSDAPTALCTSVLKRLGVTHVLNAAQGKEKGCGQVNTWSGFYSQSGIQFLGVPAFDNVVFRIYPYFEEAAQFIEDALKSKGKVLVHCRAGISRSATLVCAFLMLKRGLTVQEAVKAVRKNRAIIPNDGFLQQLCDLNDRLKRKSRL